MNVVLLYCSSGEGVRRVRVVRAGGRRAGSRRAAAHAGRQVPLPRAARAAHHARPM